MIFKCLTCGEEKTLTNTTTVYRDGAAVVKEATCCGGYMKDISPPNGIPTIIRNEHNFWK